MPTFDFQCTSCGHTFEYSRPFGSSDVPVCPKCSHSKTSKLISTPAIQFKGDGFYVTDSKEVKKEEKVEDKPKKKETKESKESKDS